MKHINSPPHPYASRALKSALTLSVLCFTYHLTGLKAQPHTATPPSTRALSSAQPHYHVVTSTYPQYAWLGALLKGVEGVNVSLLTPPDQDPAQWVPSERALSAYQRASLIVLNGAHFEAWASKVSLAPSRTIESAEALRDEWLHYEVALTHKHGPEGEHSHEGVDGHTWLDPLSALKQIELIKARLVRDLPQREALIQKNHVELIKLFKELDASWRAYANEAKTQGVTFWSSHPAYNYLKRRYQLSLKSFDLNPEESLNQAQAQALRESASALKGPLVFLWEAEPNAEAQKSLSEALKGLTTPVAYVTLSPLETAEVGERFSESAPLYFKALSALLTALRAATPGL